MERFQSLLNPAVQYNNASDGMRETWQVGGTERLLKLPLFRVLVYALALLLGYFTKCQSYLDAVWITVEDTEWPYPTSITTTDKPGM